MRSIATRHELFDEVWGNTGNKTTFVVKSVFKDSDDPRRAKPVKVAKKDWADVINGDAWYMVEGYVAGHPEDLHFIDCDDIDRMDLYLDLGSSKRKEVE